MPEGTVMKAIVQDTYGSPASWSSGSWLQGTWNYPAPDRRRCPRPGPAGTVPAAVMATTTA